MSPAPRIAIFAGTFDPLTSGHLDVIRRAARLFDELVVALLVNDEKSPMFPLAEREAMIRESTSDIPNVTVDRFEGLLVEFARRRGAAALVRGIRGVADFDYEWQMSLMNRHLDPSIDTVMLMPSAEHTYVSSRRVREIVSLGGSARGLVPPAVEARIDKRRRGRLERQA
jgi:pantetheine-phosphate adenylyltransferase